MTVWFCPRCRCDQSVGANLVALYAGVDGWRLLVRCPDCTTAIDSPCDEDTAQALSRASLAQAAELAGFREALDRPDAADLFGGGRG